ncbi:transketolase, partial [Patescibacteria group bacterium]|nr:transketolase [Patescibacteria group bacterium]
LYACLAEAGYFPKRELWSLRNLGSPLQGHPVYKSIAGVENTAGSLGQGASVAVGIAYAIRYFEKSNQMVYCVSSDEEHNQGQIWEAIMFVAKHKLPNLTMIIDRNNIQSHGNTEDIMPIERLKDKYEAFNWKVIDIDGHDIDQIINACSKAREIREKPVCIIANTIPGKGVKFMEGNFEWRGKQLKDDEADNALRSIGIKV